MKLTPCLSGLLAAAALCGATLESSAQLTIPYLNTFATTNSVLGWYYDYGVVPGSWMPMSWDAGKDAANNPNSGSLKALIPWNGSATYQWLAEYWYQNSLQESVTMIGAYVTNLSFDIHVDPSSPTGSAGNFGSLLITFGGKTWEGSTMTLPLSASNGWMHVSIPIPTNTYTNYVDGFNIQMDAPSGVALNSTTLFWIDNFQVGAIANYTNSFNEASSAYGADPGSSATSWVYWQGLYVYGTNMSWDATVDANNNPASGSLEISIPWTNNGTGTLEGQGNLAGANLFQTMCESFANQTPFDNAQTTSGYDFQSIQCSVLVSPNSPMNAAGNYGVLQIGFVSDVTNAYGLWSAITWPASAVTLNANASAGWTNIVVPIDYSTPGLGSISGIFLRMQTYAAQGGGLPGTTVMWVDNLGMAANTGPVAPATTNVSQASANFVINGVNPVGNMTPYYVMLSSTNLTQWTPVATNAFNANGTFSYTNALNASQPAMYYTFYATNIGIYAPGASFLMSTNLGVAPFTVYFADTSTKNPTSWFWTFGDGGTSTDQSPSHTFTNIWRQTVTLTASNAYGAVSCSQPVFQCFPCDALYQWNGVPGQVATVATLSNSLVPGGNTLGRFMTTNYDLSTSNLKGMIFTNLPGMTNGCPVVFSNGVVDTNLSMTTALAYSFTNDHENYAFVFNSGLVVTDLVLIFYASVPLTNGAFVATADETGFTSAEQTSEFQGDFVLNRSFGEDLGPLVPTGGTAGWHSECDASPPTVGQLLGAATNAEGAWVYIVPNKIYRVLMEENINGACTMAFADPVTSACLGLITNCNVPGEGLPLVAYCAGHVSGEVFIGNLTCIQTCRDVLSVNRPLTWSQVSNVVMYGP